MKFLGNILFFLFILTTSTQALAQPFLMVDYAARRSLIMMGVTEHPAHTGQVKIDLGTAKLALIPQSTSTPATVQTALEWFKATNGQLLDAQILEALLKNQSMIPEEWKKYSLIYFFGTIFENDQNQRQVAYLRWDGVSWCSNYVALDRTWKTTDRAAYLN